MDVHVLLIQHVHSIYLLSYDFISVLPFRMDSNSPYNQFDTENTSQRNQPSADPAMYTVEPSSSHVIQNYYNPRKFGPIQIVCGGISIILNVNVTT